MGNDYYIYVLMDSSKKGTYLYGDLILNYEPFYIGKGKGDRINRTLYDKSPFKRNKINKLKKSNIDIISYKIYENLNNESSIKIEKDLIRKIGRRDLNEGSLVNMTDGGDGRLNSFHSPEVRLKISKKLKGVGLGRNHTKETKIKMSISQKGENNGFYSNHHTDKIKESHSDRVSGFNHPMYNKKHTKETKEILKKHRKDKISNDKIKESCQKFNKPVLMYSLSMDFIKEFESVKESSKELNINESIISKCCRGDIKNPTRYYFKYKKIEDKIMNNRFLIPINSRFMYNRKEHILKKRNKKTAICIDNNNKEVIVHEKNFKPIFGKETNNSDIVELHLWLKNYLPKVKLEYTNYGSSITYSNIKIYYNKLINSSEIFQDKKEIFNRGGINIFEDEWLNKKDIVKSRLKNIIGKSEKIWARKCNIKEISDNSLIREFLKGSHTQGFVGSKVKLGLFYDDELVSLMTFGNLRKNLNQKSKEGSYELLRFCNKLNTTVVGGSSKLFKYFIKNYNPEYIVSYSDNRWGVGNLYMKLGFELSSNKITPSYFYIVNDERKGRFNFRKDKLIRDGFDGNLTEVEIQHNRGYYRIFDAGSKKYEYYFR